MGGKLPHYKTTTNITLTSNMATVLTTQEVKNLDELSQTLGDSQQIITLVDMLLELALIHRASDLHIEPFADEIIVRLRIDGVLYDAYTMPKAAHDRVLARMKVLANLKIDEHRTPQDGRFVGTFGDKVSDFRISVLPLMFGEKIVVRLLPRETKTLTLGSLGFDQKSTALIGHNVRKPYGMLLVCGPTGSGKSTTLYTLLQQLLEERGQSANINTIEDPVEYAIPRVNQIQAGMLAGLSFGAGIRGLLRQDADVIMVGEIRDQETAVAAIEASLSGILLLSSLHTRDAVGAIIRLLEVGIEPYLVSSALTIVIAQRLVRLLCKHCVKPYVMEEATYRDLDQRFGLNQIIIDIEKRAPDLAPIAKPLKLFRAGGCDECKHTGYIGRTAVFEVLEITDTTRGLIGQRASAQTLREQALREGLVTMFQNGFLKTIAGQTTLEEVLKVTLE